MRKIGIIFVIISSLFLNSCSLSNRDIPLKNELITETISNEEKEQNSSEITEIKLLTQTPQKIEENIPEPIYEELTLVAAGDNLIHSMVIKSGIKENNTYDYNYMYDNIKEYINSFDVAILNQETVLINDSSKYSGYPCFGSPIEIGDAVINAGFDIITQATNHAYDKKEEGINDSVEYWNKNDIPVLGIHTTPDDNVFIYKHGNFKIAMLNYTYSLNGFTLPDGKNYLVDSLYDEEKIKKDLAYTENNADFTIVFPHWGTEYTHTETNEQIRLAEFLAENGADLIIGAHPHVIEPLKIITTTSGKEVPVYYSLGNFISNQDETPRMLGALAEITLVYDDGNVYIKEYKATPVVTHITKGQKSFQTYLLKDYPDDLASQHKLSLSLDKLWSIWNNVFPEEAKDIKEEYN